MNQKISLFQQNMALLPDLPLPNGDNLYQGHEREKALAGLAAYLAASQPAVVGLSEMWVPAERVWLQERLADIYPHHLSGPGRSDGSSLDGGLQLLSRRPFLAQHMSVYTACMGEDCLAQKGVLHAQVRLPAPLGELDLFLTHLQNPNPFLASPNNGSGENGRQKVQDQLDNLRAFMDEVRDPSIPALLMGDLNSDANDPALYADLMARLGHPADLWLETEQGELALVDGELKPIGKTQGHTFDPACTFTLTAEESAHQMPPNPDNAPERIDYFLCFNGRSGSPRFKNTTVVRLESSPGRNLSDHYGLLIAVE